MKKVLFIFGVLDDADVDWMTRHGRRRAVVAGEVLVREGQALDALHIVLEGAFEVTVAARRSPALARLGAGEVVGEVSFVDSRAPVGTVTALRGGSVLTLGRSLVAERLARDTGFSARFHRAIALTLAHRLRKLMMPAAGAEGGDDGAGDELDAGVLDTVHLAGARFERMLAQLLAG